MWVYEKKLQIPVRVSIPDVRMAARLITQYGGPDFRLCIPMTARSLHLKYLIA
ncbi:MAG: manganese catalase family protein [Ignavibacteriales bacterium]